MPVFRSEFTCSEEAAIAKEFHRVGVNCYLDHAGTTLYTESQVDAAAKMLKENLFCNPHTCNLTGDLIDQVRYRILKHFNADATEYSIVFTTNATAALKTVAECFQFGSPNNVNEATTMLGSFYYCQENHTSVLGMREVVQTPYHFVLTKDQLLMTNDVGTLKCIPPKISPQTTNNSLVVFSAQCNFSGYKMPLELIQTIQSHGLSCRGKQIQSELLVKNEGHLKESTNRDESNFYVCLDTASFVASNYLNLQRYKPDFCCISFYKMFGFPTGVGALIVSKRGQMSLEKKYYGGGTVKIAMTRQNFHEKRQGFTERFEDGTLPFLSIASLLEGFRTLDRLIPATPQKPQMERIATHVFQLAQYCHDALAQLRHANGAPLIKFYNHNGYEACTQQGGIVTFNVLRDDGSFVGFAEVACIAAVHSVQLRTGCFCNPGACQHFLQLSDTDIRQQFEAGHICSDYNDLIDGQPTGAVRMSFGYMTQCHHIDKAVTMLCDCYRNTTATQRFRLLEAKSEQLPLTLQNIPQRLRPQLKRLCVYPIKSCAAYIITKGQWRLTKAGFEYDRNWMIVDANGVAMTQKRISRLCLLKPLINFEKAQLELTFPGMNAISVVPLESHPNTFPNGHRIIESNLLCQSKLCSDVVEGLDCGDAVAAWLSDCLEIDGLRLLRQCVNARGRRTPSSGLTKDISLANQAQFLLINSTSVRWLADKINDGAFCEPLQHTIDRFRANIIIETVEPLEENTFEEICIGDVRFTVDGLCSRCQMICIDQHSGEKTTEPLRTIARQFNGKIRFGIYLSLNETKINYKTMSLNDEIVLLKSKVCDDFIWNDI